MAGQGFAGAFGVLSRKCAIVPAIGCSLMLGACSQMGAAPLDVALDKPAASQTQTASGPGMPGTSSMTTASTDAPQKAPVAAAAATGDKPPPSNRAALQKATEFWGKAYSKNQNDAQAALNFARNLRAMGEKQQAMSVLQQAVALNGRNRELLSEYGRVALDLDQITVAQKVLEPLDDPTAPDWRVISARGTVFAKQGQYREAIALYERAQQASPDQPSVLNNLGLAHIMNGDAQKAETVLRRAVAIEAGDARINQNLSLALSLQGKYDEAKVALARDLPPDGAASNVEFMKKIANLPAKPMGVAEVAPASWSSQVAAAKP